MNIQEFMQVLQSAWSQDTSYYPDEWNSNNPAYGQCSPTAIVVQDYFGGEILWCEALLPEWRTEDHYFNIIEDEIIDLTASQFPGGTIMSVGTAKNKGFPSTRDFMLSYENTRRRYEILRDRVNQKLVKIKLAS